MQLRLVWLVCVFFSLVVVVRLSDRSDVPQLIYCIGTVAIFLFALSPPIRHRFSSLLLSMVGQMVANAPIHSKSK